MDANAREVFARLRAWPHMSAILVWTFALLAVGGVLFNSGFMLTRLSLPDRAAPVAADFATPHYRRVVLVLVDALGYDFAAPDLSPTAPVWANRLPVFTSLARAYPSSTALLRFIADAPTTTMQRVKALMTGTLPTFVEFGSNFNADALGEDSLPARWADARRGVDFVGDDLWAALFPGLLVPTNHSIPGLDVRDLHSVDNGVFAHLNAARLAAREPEPEPEPAVLIGHLVGVDHCGHTYSLDHPLMLAKLDQVNRWLTELAAQIDNDTLLVVMGDHGLSRDGGHGGASEREVSAALFVFSRRAGAVRAVGADSAATDASTPALAMGERVLQVDLVPTLAALTGVAPPFASVGKPINALLCSRHREPARCVREILLPFTRDVAARMRDYIRAYSERTTGSPVDARLANEVAALDAAIAAADAALAASPGEPAHALAALQAVEHALDGMAGAARARWTTFDEPAMATGLALLATAAVVLGVSVAIGASSRASLDLGTPLVGGLTVGVLALLALKSLCPPALAGSLGLGESDNATAATLVAVFALAGASISAFGQLAVLARTLWLSQIRESARALRHMSQRLWLAFGWRALGAALLALHTAGQFTSSFILAERTSVRYLLLSGLLVSALYAEAMFARAAAGLAAAAAGGVDVSAKRMRMVLWDNRQTAHCAATLAIGFVEASWRLTVCAASHLTCEANLVPWWVTAPGVAVVGYLAFAFAIIFYAREARAVPRCGGVPVLTVVAIQAAVVAVQWSLEGVGALPAESVPAAALLLPRLTALLTVLATIALLVDPHVPMTARAAVHVYDVHAGLLLFFWGGLTSVLVGSRSAVALFAAIGFMASLRALVRAIQLLESLVAWPYRSERVVADRVIVSLVDLVAGFCTTTDPATGVTSGVELATGRAVPVPAPLTVIDHDDLLTSIFARESARDASAAAESHALGGPPATGLVLHALGALHFLFTYGVRFEFSALRFEPAFVLAARFESTWLAGPAVALATSAPLLIFAIGLLGWLAAPLCVALTELPELSEPVDPLYDLALGRVVRRGLYSALVFLSLPTASMVASAAFVQLERRNLLALRVFAPKLAFDTGFGLLAWLYVAIVLVAVRAVQNSCGGQLIAKPHHAS